MIFFYPLFGFGALTSLADATIEQRLSQAEAARRFLAAYPDFLTGYDAAKQELIGWDGTRLPLAGTEKNNCQDNTAALSSASSSAGSQPCCSPGPLETLGVRYRPVAEYWPSRDDPPKPDEDAGRLRPLVLWTYMYGAPAAKNADGCWRTVKVGNSLQLLGGAVEKNLAPVVWKLAGNGVTIRVSRANGVDRHLAAVVAELETISAEAKAQYRRIHGCGKTGVSGFYPRLVRGTICEISPHAFGVAIDVHWRPGLDYWLDSPQRGGYRYQSVMPKEIVAVFERHGFIWGGKWRHFDGMHFEYRPELLDMTMPPVGRPSVAGASGRTHAGKHRPGPRRPGSGRRR
ncbi:MAG: M15 family metallopeptidase [Desulfobulbaceae bacterium]|nr:M15 family metallopeptidase [Desulfobulbaceae bacterium]